MDYCYIVIFQDDLIVSGINLKSIIEYLSDFSGDGAYFDSFEENDSIYNNDKLIGKLIFKEESDGITDRYEFDLYKVDFAKPTLQELRDDNISDILE